MSSNSKTYNKALNKFVKTCINLHKGVDEVIEIKHAFDTTKFNSQLDALSIKIKAEASKFALAFKPPAVNEKEEACKCFIEPLTQLVLLTNMIPTNQGVNFAKQIQLLTKNVIKSIIELGNSFSDDPTTIEEDIKVEKISFSQNDYLSCIGVVWNNCDKLKKAPIDNKESTLRIWSTFLELIKDTVKEIEELKEEAENMDDKDEEEKEVSKEEKDLVDEFADLDFGLSGESFDEKELEVITTCLSILKLVQTVFIKIDRRCIKECSVTTDGVISWLDELVDSAQTIIDSLDNLGASLWDRDNDEIVSSAKEVTNNTKIIINHSLLYSEKEHEPWFQNASKQFDKLIAKISNDDANR